MTDKRPVFLNLFQIQLPVTALVSILHRVSGVVMFLTLPLWLYLYEQLLFNNNCLSNDSILSPNAVDCTFNINYYFSGFIGVIFFGSLIAYTYHAIAGIRHIIFDYGSNHSLEKSRFTAILTIALTAIFLALYFYFWFNNTFGY